MEMENIRQKLHQYIEKGDEKLLRLLHIVAQEYNNEADNEWDYTNEFKKELDRRYADYKNEGTLVSAMEADKQIKELLEKTGQH